MQFSRKEFESKRVLGDKENFAGFWTDGSTATCTELVTTRNHEVAALCIKLSASDSKIASLDASFECRREEVACIMAKVSMHADRVFASAARAEKMEDVCSIAVESAANSRMKICVTYNYLKAAEPYSVQLKKMCDA